MDRSTSIASPFPQTQLPAVSFFTYMKSVLNQSFRSIGMVSSKKQQTMQTESRLSRNALSQQTIHSCMTLEFQTKRGLSGTIVIFRYRSVCTLFTERSQTWRIWIFLLDYVVWRRSKRPYCHLRSWRPSSRLVRCWWRYSQTWTPTTSLHLSFTLNFLYH